MLEISLGPLGSAHLKVQILLPLAVLLQLATFDLAVGWVGAQFGQFGRQRFEASFVGFDLVLLQSGAEQTESSGCRTVR